MTASTPLASSLFGAQLVANQVSGRKENTLPHAFPFFSRFSFVQIAK